MGERERVDSLASARSVHWEQQPTWDGAVRTPPDLLIVSASETEIEIYKKLDQSLNKRDREREIVSYVDGILKCLLSHIIIADIKDQSPLLVVSAGLFY